MRWRRRHKQIGCGLGIGERVQYVELCPSHLVVMHETSLRPYYIYIRLEHGSEYSMYIIIH